MNKEKFNSLLLVNFGGPRDIKEIKPFLISLLTDQSLVQTSFPPSFHRFLFSKIAFFRALQMRKAYRAIGGGSPLFRETEELARRVEERVKCPTFAFHRYLESTHAPLLKKLETMKGKTFVFPLFPHFSTATTGASLTYLEKKLSKEAFSRLVWQRSYATHPRFISLWQERISRYLQEKRWKEEEVILLFSAHNVYRRLIDAGDSYEKEIQESFEAIKTAFPLALSALGYQSRLRWGQWLTPETLTLVKSVKLWGKGRGRILMIPLSFTFDQLETLWEMENKYLALLRREGFQIERISCFGTDLSWIDFIGRVFSKQEELGPSSRSFNS